MCGIITGKDAMEKSEKRKGGLLADRAVRCTVSRMFLALRQ